MTNGIVAAIARFEPREAYNEMMIGNDPICLACGEDQEVTEVTAAGMHPLCDSCAHEFVREAAQLLMEISERLS
jgi:hypothetical protein